jgi:hypothetical protein
MQFNLSMDRKLDTSDSEVLARNIHGINVSQAF